MSGDEARMSRGMGPYDRDTTGASGSSSVALLGRQVVAVGGVMATGLAIAMAAWGSSSSNYDGLATRAVAKADKAARISRPGAGDSAVGSPELRFEFKLAHNTGEVAVYRSHSDAEQGLAKAKLVAKAFGVSLEDYVFLVQNVVIGFEKVPTKAERNEAMSWLRPG
jgi:hypothetical protein